MNQPLDGPVRPQPREWSRNPDEKKIAGVCAGISSHLDVPVTALRAIFVVLALPSFSSVGIVLYLALCPCCTASVQCSMRCLSPVVPSRTVAISPAA